MIINCFVRNKLVYYANLVSFKYPVSPKMLLIIGHVGYVKRNWLWPSIAFGFLALTSYYLSQWRQFWDIIRCYQAAMEWNRIKIKGNLTHWNRDKMDAMLQFIFSNAFSWMKTFEFCLGFHWSVFLGFELTTSFRYRLGTKQATSHYLSQWLSMLPTHICVTRPQWFNAEFISLLNELCINYSWTLLMASNYWRNWWLTF